MTEWVEHLAFSVCFIALALFWVIRSLKTGVFRNRGIVVRRDRDLGSFVLGIAYLCGFVILGAMLAYPALRELLR